MTGDPPVLDRPALWDAISNMQIEEPGAARRFEETLAREQGWPLGFAERVKDEYRRFLYLAATAGFEVTPSQTVDEAWHLHLSSRHYQEVFCGQILGRPLDHRPATGAPSEAQRHRRQYEETVALYERIFGNPPPADIWPRPTADEDDWEDGSDASDQGKALGQQIAFGSLLGGIAAMALGAPLIGIVLIGAALIVALVTRTSAKAGSRGSDSGGCGGGGDGGSSNDCASCGGASCGGGGCGGD